MNRPQRSAGRASAGSVALEFLGSMNLAITLLVALSVAAVIGTVLQQNQPYNDYLIEFGPFWFEVFASLGLYDVYAAPWFLLLLGFLLVSTAVCVLRHTPGLLRDMRQFRLDVRDKSLRAFRHQAEWRVPGELGEQAERLSTELTRAGYRVRRKRSETGITLGAMKGAAGRLGYFFTHVAIVVICVGGLIDGNIGLKLADYAGRIAPETRNLPIAQVPERSVLGPDSSSFRGSISIPEGSSADFVFLRLRDGYLVQNLPFTVALEDFRIEHYPTGQPKSFESDLLLFDDAEKTPLRQTIAVNQPLFYKGYAIYQSSFSDGGSRLTLAAWPLDSPPSEPLALDGKIGERIRLDTSDGPLTLELTDFKPLNIFPLPEDDPSGKRFQNYGPSVVFKVRDADGRAREYVNYMSPLDKDGQSFFLSGMRESPGETFRYLHIPLDAAGSIDRFMRFRALMLDRERLQAVVQEQLAGFGDREGGRPSAKLGDSIMTLVELFVREGVDAVVAEAETSASDGDATAALNAYMKVIQSTLAASYVELLAEEGQDLEAGVDPAEQRFFDASMNALSLLGPYGSPFVVRLADFEQVQASGLQITRSPGKPIVYFGCVMLMAGVFFMFYLHHRRIWVRLVQGESGVGILLAGAGHRDRADFADEFSTLRARLERISRANHDRGGE